MDITGKAVLVTGGRRIGAVVADHLAARGADLALGFHRSEREATRAVEAARARGRRAVSIHADLSRAAECVGLVDQAVGALGRLDVLVNMASVYEATPFDAVTPEVFQRGLAVDLTASYLCARAAVPHMRAAGGGRIVNFSDWTAASGRPRYRGYLPYYVAKTAVIGLTQALALELAADGILVTAVAPGPILAPPGTSEAERDAVARATPLGRWGGAEEVARIVVGLVESDFVTGETVRVDGGRHVS
jgi:NAD(P)-dependent dehydrogenase (short-subunit alcohol dehydrogenase family)